MMDSLAYRNDAAIVFRRLIRSLPTRRGVLGVATCDKGLPAMMMALAAMRDLPCVLVPGGVTLPAARRRGRRQGAVDRRPLRPRRADAGARGRPRAAAPAARRAAAASSWARRRRRRSSARRSACRCRTRPSRPRVSRSGSTWRAARPGRSSALHERGLAVRDILTDAAVRNAMTVHAAFGGSTNLLLHIPAIAHAAGLRRPTVDDWSDVNRRVPRLVDVLPNGPHPTVRVFLAGGVPEVMLHLRRERLLDESCLTVTGEPLGAVLDWWERSERRQRAARAAARATASIPTTCIMSPERAQRRGLTSTVTFPRGNLAPEGSVIKSTAIDPSVVDADGVYRKRGPARVFTTERAAIAAIKGQGPRRIEAGRRPRADLPRAAGGRHGGDLPDHLGAQAPLVRQARRRAHRRALLRRLHRRLHRPRRARGPRGRPDRQARRRRRDPDRRSTAIASRAASTSSATAARSFGPEEGARVLAARPPRPDLAPDPELPDDTRLWAALQHAGGGTWGGCVYDVDAITAALAARAR